MPVEACEHSPVVKSLPYGRQCIDEDDITAVVCALRGDWLTQGPAVAAFEEAIADYCGAKYAVAVSSGTAALHLACIAAGLGPGEVGITSPITFVASANCIAYCGASPEFADVDPGSITLCPPALRQACQLHRPAVVIPVDFAGAPADLPAIYEIAHEHGALVIEDAAHSLGASYTHNDKVYRVGSCEHADMAIFSFHPVKHITTGEGGAILTNDPNLYQRLQDFRTHGITKDPSRIFQNDGPWYYEQHLLGFNYRITDIQCALGLSQLNKLPAFLQRRRELVGLYTHLLADLTSGIELLLEPPGTKSSYHLMVGMLCGGAERRRAVYDYLHAHGIRAQVHYIPVHLQPWYLQRGHRKGDFPNAEAYYSQCISLPLFPGMSDDDVQRVVDILGECIAR